MKISGAPESVKPNGEAAVSSIPVNSGAPNGVSSGDVGLMKSKGPAADSSTPVKPTGKLGASSGLKIGVSGKPPILLMCQRQSYRLRQRGGANGVIADVVVNPEPATLGELLAYMKQPSAKCMATIDDVVHGSKWYYIGCGDCHTKATIGPTTLMCKKCGKNEIVGVPQYLSKLFVYDHQDQAMFLVLGDAGEELFGKKAVELIESYYQANDGASEDDIVPVPQAMVDAIG
ncbi:unnamed protein product [Eruca vesicaria subsp. sativa]|uniref:Replication factor A C-terminal domain-containing protein n=1 Tax=Eruca vesicaria subsp. sativa TaxID=29727 RepID=A0ABC8KTR2_ERUVS|nr:unnamed protein product [Eruca vesicaria subsp. sativa]